MKTKQAVPRTPMDYERFVEAARQLPFIRTDDMAEAAVKAVIGTLASQFDEHRARRLTRSLPPPLNVQRLHSHQVGALPITIDEYISEIAEQFHINRDDARQLICRILHVSKEAGLRQEMISQLPPDWVAVVNEA